MGAEGRLLVPEEGIRTKAQKVGLRTEGKVRTFDYEPKERHNNELKEEREAQARQKAHSGFTQVRGPRER